MTVQKWYRMAHVALLGFLIGAFQNCSDGYKAKDNSSHKELPTPLTPPGPSAKPVDLFLVAGQSNAVGHGNAAQSPLPTAGSAFEFRNGSLHNLNRFGSAWPAFAIEYNRLTSRPTVFTPTAVSGSSLTAIADVGSGNWSSSGALLQKAIEEIHAARAYLTGQGQNPTIKGILWSQGETDASALALGILTKDQYKNALKDLISRFRAQLGSETRFYIFRTGTQLNSSDSGFKQVREAQEEVAQEVDLVHVVFRGAIDFPIRAYMADAFHYTQSGYNEMGLMGARGVLERLSLLLFLMHSLSTGRFWLARRLSSRSSVMIKELDLEVAASRTN